MTDPHDPVYSGYAAIRASAMDTILGRLRAIARVWDLWPSFPATDEFPGLVVPTADHDFPCENFPGRLSFAALARPG